IYVGLVMPIFLFIYQAIVLAEENFLRNKFGSQFDQYCSRVNRWLINFKGLAATFKSMRFNTSRWLLKEYNTQFVWMVGITLLLLLKYPEVTQHNTDFRNILLAVILSLLVVFYFTIRYLKKSGKMTG